MKKTGQNIVLEVHTSSSTSQQKEMCREKKGYGGERE
jgi:hypothetical protein